MASITSWSAGLCSPTIDSASACLLMRFPLPPANLEVQGQFGATAEGSNHLNAESIGSKNRASDPRWFDEFTERRANSDTTTSDSVPKPVRIRFSCVHRTRSNKCQPFRPARPRNLPTRTCADMVTIGSAPPVKMVPRTNKPRALPVI